MKKTILLMALSAAFALTCVGLVACTGGGEEDPETFTVTFYDGDQTTVLKTEVERRRRKQRQNCRKL